MVRRLAPCLKTVMAGLLVLLPASSYGGSFQFNNNLALCQEVGIVGYGSLRSTPCSVTSDPGAGWTETVDALGEAYADNTTVGAYVKFFVSFSGVPIFSVNGPDGIVTVDQMSDQITVSGGTGSGILRLPVSLDGTSSTNNPAYTAGVLFSIGVVGGPPAASAILTSAGSQDLLIPFTFGDAFTLNRFLQVTIDTGGVSGPTGPIGGIADYLHTAQLGPFSVFDGGMTPISGAAVTGGTGFNYAVAPTADPVPEPASLLLVAAGLAGARRRFAKRR